MKATTLSSSKQSNLIRILKPQTPKLLLIRHLSTQDDPSFTTQILTLLQHPHNEWNTNQTLKQLLSPSPSLSPLSLLKITRNLGTTQKALNFFNFIQTISPTPLHPPFLSFTLQAIFELSTHEQQNPHSPNLSQLFDMAKELKIPLTVNSATLLIRCFGRAGMAEKSLLVYNYVDPDLRNTHVRNVVVESLLRSGCVDDALKVLDEMLDPDTRCPPNGNTVDIVFAALLGRSWSGRSVSEEEIVGLVLKFGKLGVIPSAVWLTQLVTKLCRSGNSSRAWDLLCDLMEFGEMEAASCNALLTGLGREGDFETLNVVLKKMKEKNIVPNVVTFGILINHLCKFRRVDAALEVLENMREGTNGISVEPDVIIYNTLIDGLCKVGRKEEGLVLMEKMILQHGCSPNTETYNCLIDGFCKAGEIDRSLELFDQMNKEKVLPNVITLNSLIDGMCKHGRINSAMEFFNEMQAKNLKANAVTYTALIRAFCSANNIEKAMKLFDEMVKTGCTPDAIVYYTLISGLCQAGRLDDASFVVSMMEKAGFLLDIVSYNILIGGFCRQKKLDKAYELLKDMESAGVKPDSVTYNTLISYFSESGDFVTAHRVMKRMTNDGLVPTVVTYGSLIHAYCLVGNFDEAMKIFSEMSANSRVKPNTVIYNILIDCLCKNKKVEAAVSLMEDMKAKEVRPSTTTYNAMFKGLREMNWLEKALKLMDHMTEQACNPDYITMEILTDWLSSVGETDKLRSFVQGYEVSASTT